MFSKTSGELLCTRLNILISRYLFRKMFNLTKTLYSYIFYSLKHQRDKYFSSSISLSRLVNHATSTSKFNGTISFPRKLCTDFMFRLPGIAHGKKAATTTVIDSLHYPIKFV